VKIGKPIDFSAINLGFQLRKWALQTRAFPNEKWENHGENIVDLLVSRGHA
jgi:hypothetical protein